MTLALKRRLVSWASVGSKVATNARSLLEGRFDAMGITGADWVTPLGMTAHRIDVSIGAMQVDLDSLVWQQRVAMRNVPQGEVTIQLSGRDMGAFVSHPLFRQAAATAVHGQAFEWDRDSIAIDHAANSVTYTGRWAGDGQRYRVIMLPGQPSAGGKRGQLQVGAQPILEPQPQQQPQQPQLQQPQQPQPQQQEQQQPQLQQQQQPSQPQLPREQGAPDLQGAQQVASGMAAFFSQLALDLQGIEIRSPVLSLAPGNASARGEGDLLTIRMRLRLRALPPLDMQF